MICRDGAGRGFTVKIFDGKPNWDLWVCSQCNLPTRMVFTKLTGLRCPQGATALLHVRSRQDGINEIIWAVPDGRKTTLHFAAYPGKVGMAEQATHLNTLWGMLDSAIDAFKAAGEDDPAIVRHKHQARCMSEVLFVLMQPFYENADAVAKEGLARWKARQSGTKHESPGLAEAIWDPNTRFDGTPYAVDPARRAKPLVTGIKNDKQIPPSAVAGVKKAYEAKMMTVAQLAKMYGVSEATVRTAVGV